ncbi:class I SAM-dependent methyltransferase [Actinomycetospora sp. OC33-EN08]|uniref:Class I SAM-dependent methyltransferase n=1 Tax=Actinomycetospora aurantiaca TaxID=3129233 RepID=A0ABU8MR10_9PSEU
MSDTDRPATDQAALWNGGGGDTWVRMQPVLDDLFAPVSDLLVGAVGDAVGGGGRVLDVGCGTGATTLALARRGEATGVDVSVPMIELARRRAADEGSPARFVVADAQRYAFDPGGADVVASRFGVMFFDDPVAAFANLHRAVASGGALRMVVWRSAEENPFMTTGPRAAASVLTVPTPPPDAPGQFALADPDRVRTVLGDGGWQDVAVDPVDVTTAMPAADLEDYALSMGPVGRLLPGLDDATRARVAELVVPAFEQFVVDGSARIELACWLVSARA